MSLQSFFGFGPSLDIELVLDGQDTRKTAEIKAEDGKIETHYLYYDGETIGGKVFVSILIYVFQYKEPSVPKMTYYVSVGTLNLTRSLTHTHAKASNTLIDNFFYHLFAHSLPCCLVIDEKRGKCCVCFSVPECTDLGKCCFLQKK